jgi:hypothetical protein
VSILQSNSNFTISAEAEDSELLDREELLLLSLLTELLELDESDELLKDELLDCEDDDSLELEKELLDCEDDDSELLDIELSLE